MSLKCFSIPYTYKHRSYLYVLKLFAILHGVEKKDQKNQCSWIRKSSLSYNIPIFITTVFISFRLVLCNSDLLINYLLFFCRAFECNAVLSELFVSNLFNDSHSREPNYFFNHKSHKNDQIKLESAYTVDTILININSHMTI